MNDFEDKLGTILNDPQAMSKIMALAQSLGGGSAEQPCEPQPSPASESGDEEMPWPDANLLKVVSTLMGQYNRNDERKIALLNALRPYVKEKRFAKLDKAVQIARLSSTVRTALELLKRKEDDDV